jgi:hypothetical protein
MHESSDKQLPSVASSEQPQEWTEERVADLIVEAFESAGETRAIKLISERHNAALAAIRTELEDMKRLYQDSYLYTEPKLQKELAAEQARCYNDGWVAGRESMEKELAAEREKVAQLFALVDAKYYEQAKRVRDK